MSDSKAIEAGEQQMIAHHDELDETTGVYTIRKLASPEGASEEGEKSESLKMTEGGIVLVPQPSDDPNDPLNWSWLKKHSVFLALLPGCFLTDWVITYGVQLFEAQAMDWHVSKNVVQSTTRG
jgi:hypothetical protein